MGMATQTETEKQEAQIFTELFDTQIDYALDTISIIPVRTDEALNTIVIKIPKKLITLLKRNYLQVMEKLKRNIFKNAEIFFIRNCQVTKSSNRGIVEDISFPALVGGRTEEYSNGGAVITKKCFVRPFGDLIDGDRLRIMERVYETVVGDEIRFLLGNY